MDQKLPSVFSRKSKIIATVAYLIVAGVICGFFFFAQPLADDFCRASVAHGEEYKYLQGMYNAYSGRWAGAGSEIMVLSRFDPTRYYYELIFFIWLLHVGAVLFLVYALFGHKLSRRLILVMTASLVILMWTGMPLPGETVYWFTGSIEYQLNISLSLVLFAVLIRKRLEVGLQWRVLLQIIGLSLFAIFITGMHELFGLILCLCLMVGTAIAYCINHPNRRAWAVVLVAATAGLVFVVVAPGNFIRLENHPRSEDVIVTLNLMKMYAKDTVSKWLLDPKLLSATLLFVIHPQISAFRPKWLTRQQIPWKWVILGAWLICIAAGFVFPSWSLGEAMPHRVANGVYTIFVLGWFATVFVFTRWPIEKPYFSTTKFRSIASGTLIVFALSIVLTGTIPVALSDLRHNAVPWHDALLQRYNRIWEGVYNGRVEIRIPRAPKAPRIFPDWDVSTEIQFWRNKCYANFFGVKYIGLVKESQNN
jgi:hypothetical protein